MTEKFNYLAFGYASAIVSAVSMLLLGILGNFGINLGAVRMMQQWHMFFSLSSVGILGGAIEGAANGFVFGCASGWLYNKFV